MPDLSRLENLPQRFRALSERAAALTGENLDAAPLLDAVARYMALREERPDLTAQVRFEMLFGDATPMSNVIPVWTQLIHDVLQQIQEQLHAAAASIPGPDVTERTEAALLYVVESFTRHQQIAQPERAALVAFGELPLDEAIRSLAPREPVATTPVPAPAPRPPRPLSEIFRELIARADQCPVVLEVTPLLIAASHFAEGRAALPEDHPFHVQFPAWYKMAVSLVADVDETPQIPLLRTRAIDILLYMLECSIRVGAIDDLEARTDAILEGRSSLADALTR